MNIDKIKQDLHNFKNSFRVDLSTEELKELDAFIDNLMLDLQNKLNKIDTDHLALSMKKYLDELDNG